MAIKFYVGGLPYSSTDQDLETLFAEYGKVLSSVVIKDRDSGKSKGFGFVEMSDDNEAKAAMQALNGKDFEGRALVVNEARPQEGRQYGNSSYNKSY